VSVEAGAEEGLVGAGGTVGGLAGVVEMELTETGGAGLTGVEVVAGTDAVLTGATGALAGVGAGVGVEAATVVVVPVVEAVAVCFGLWLDL
jgi:hypothetical protein